MFHGFGLRQSLLIATIVVCFGSEFALAQNSQFPPIVNTQNPNERPPSPLEAVKKITVPPGFHVTLFAGEPHVHQPIAIHIDDRGRLWVAESYTYSGQGSGKCWVTDHKDRVLIFEDTNYDGRFDKRTVFWDQAQNLSGITTGFGGVWLLCAPHLLFIPDGNGDDMPDGKPQVVLDGWVVKGVGHNIVNGLTWGPDGWLYGRHGIMNTSHVGVPGAPPHKRVALNCSIWRYHPTKKTFEVVCHGTTNPWGFDYDDHGQMFFTNNVIGHLWHVIPGAHYKRMYGEDFDPHLYELIDQHADHYHWDNGKAWTDSRDGKGKHGELGGGHSHCGGMIYLGDNWPEQYRNTMFMCNTHGRRINNDKLVRKGSSYVGIHSKDFLFANNPWFRGVDLKYGPDGGVFLSDWVDLGECHDHDGVHRTSGRIYKITYGKAAIPKIADVAALGNDRLVQLQLHKNDWYVRTARRLLQERAAAGKEMKSVQDQLRKMFQQHPDVTRKLRALWALYVTGGAERTWLQAQLKHKSEHVRAWTIRLLVDDRKTVAASVAEFAQMAKTDGSGLVRLFLASALQRLPLEQRFLLASRLMDHAGDAADHNLPLMIWYGVEPLVADQPKKAILLASQCKIPLLRKFIARRLTEEIVEDPQPVDDLLQLATKQDSTAFQLKVLEGMAEALSGWRKAPPPKSWKHIQMVLSNSANDEIRNTVRNLSVLFGDGRAIAELKRIAVDASLDGQARRDALEVLIRNRADDLLPMLMKLIGDRATVALAAKGMAAYDHPKIPALIINNYRYLRSEDRSHAINTLVARPRYAFALLDAVADGKIDRRDISAYHARQIVSFDDANLTKQLSKVWGDVRSSSKEKKRLVEHYKQLLTTKNLQEANVVKGRMLFKKVCANCHKLFGQGETIGPDLTGGNRDSLDYLLENIIDPSAVVPVDSKMSIIALLDGRVVTGVVSQQNKRFLTVQTQNEKLTLNKGDVEEIKGTSVSLMPDGLLAPLEEKQVRDLIAYLMAKEPISQAQETSQK